MPSAVIFGVAGQDGAYLAELLAAKGYRVVGTVSTRELEGPNDIPSVVDRANVIATDLLDERNLLDVIGGFQPDEAYNLASESHLLASLSKPVATGELTGLGVTRILEAIRKASPKTRFFQASSSEIFGRCPRDVPQTEATPLEPSNVYAAAKAYGHWIVSCYRRHHGLFACSGILYNHESPRRRAEFVTRKVCRAAALIKLGAMKELRLGNLDARRDWGFAGDFVRGMWLMLQHAAPDDYILATGTTHSVRDLCEAAFRHLDLDYRDYVRRDEHAYRPAESTLLVGDSGKARRVLGWQPTVSFEELVRMMVDADLQALRADQDTHSGRQP